MRGSTPQSSLIQRLGAPQHVPCTGMGVGASVRPLWGSGEGGDLAPLNTCIPASVSPPLSEGLPASPGISVSSGLSGAWSRCVSGRGQARCMSGWDWALRGVVGQVGRSGPSPSQQWGSVPRSPTFCSSLCCSPASSELLKVLGLGYVLEGQVLLCLLTPVPCLLLEADGLGTFCLCMVYICP